MKRDFQVYIDDMLEAIRRIEKYAKDRDFTGVSKDEMVIDAIVRNFEVIGEATKHIPENLRKKYPDIPWKIMAGMRDKLIHEYFGVNIQVLLKTIKEDLPGVKQQIEKLSGDLEKQE